VDIFKDDTTNLTSDMDLQEWVLNKCQEWRDHYTSNYSEKHEEYYRLFRNQWAVEDKTRESEKSKLIAPALAQAVESNVAELEEATFGRGKIFDIDDDVADQDATDIEYLRKKLHEDFECARVRSSVSECLINAAVFGTGVAEVSIEEIKEYAPATRDAMDGAMQEYGVEIKYRPIVKLTPVLPKNFLIDPNATCIEEALGCAVDEFVSRHVVEELQEQGVYREEYVGDAPSDDEVEIDRGLDVRPVDRIRLLKYYGKVPRDLLIAAGVDEEDIETDSFYVESIVVLANEGVLLKAIPSPYMMQDRPVVAFSWDTVPSRFWGRGVCEKGYMSQKALDAELRARIDALALTTHPMVAVDATRIPRGANLEVKPGRMLLTNGNPADAIMPFKIGGLDQVTFAQGAQLQQMVSQATGAGDMTQPTVQNDVTAAGMSMSMGAIVKRQKRTLLNFQENFLLPFVRKAAWRYMQFDPENYPVKDYKFKPFSSLGAMAREYEVSQLSQILQVVPPDSPAHGAIIKGIIDHLNVTNRDELIAAIEAGSQPDPQAQQAAMQQQQMQMAVLQGQVQLLQAQAAESQSRATKYNTEAELYPQELTLKYADSNNDGETDADFERRIRLAELMLKEKEIDIKQKETEAKTQESQMSSEEREEYERFMSLLNEEEEL
jgi:hypothetical protein